MLAMTLADEQPALADLDQEILKLARQAQRVSILARGNHVAARPDDETRL
jgi:hypothetical protein